MTRSGRPLRFLGVTLAGWTALRIVLLWPGTPIPGSVIRTIAPPLAAQSAARLARSVAAGASPRAIEPTAPAPRYGADFTRRRRIALALAGPVHFGDPQIAIGPPGERIAPPPAEPPPPRRPASSPRSPPSRWSGDLWLVARRGSRRHAGFGGGQLGGAQAGVRLAYALDRARRLAAFARIDTPLAGRGREAAAGLDWRPTRLPVRIVVEERVPLDGGKATAAAGLVGGFGPMLRRGFHLEGYGQAGAIARRGGEGFADGAVRVTRPIGRLAGIAFDLGAGAWGGAQRDAARLDVGPSLGASVSLDRHTIRVALDWRARVAGHARPGSGLALTIGASF
jgi:hypothetical protein